MYRNLNIDLVVAVVLAIALLFGITMYFLCLNGNQPAPAYPWRIAGTTIDESNNPIPDVNVIITGTVRITVINNIFGTKPNTFTIESETDSNGRFAFNVAANHIHLIFRKLGFEEQTTNFIHLVDVGDNTNQILRICLNAEISHK